MSNNTFNSTDTDITETDVQAVRSKPDSAGEQAEATSAAPPVSAESEPNRPASTAPALPEAERKPTAKSANDDSPIILMYDDEVICDENEPLQLKADRFDRSKIKQPEAIKKTLGGRISNFFYHYGKILLISSVLIALLIGLIYTSYNEPMDALVSIFSRIHGSDAYTAGAMEELFESVCEDTNGNGTVHVDIYSFNLVEADDDIYGSNYLQAVTFFESDSTKAHKCFIYLMDKDNYDMAESSIFTSYNGCPLWIPLEGTSLAAELAEQGFDVSTLGISLIAPNDDVKADKEAFARYENAVSILDGLREKYPDVFEN